jgi:hypothetical protein
MKNGQSFYLDPDFRKLPPKGKPYCVRCQKEIKDISKAVKVTVNWQTIQVQTDPKGTELIGRDCWKIVMAS